MDWRTGGSGREGRRDPSSSKTGKKAERGESESNSLR